jgi:hypothetical protein
MARKKEKIDDDGRVIANMNVDGMPWYAGFTRGKGGDADPSVPVDPEANREELSKLGKKQTFFLILGVLGAAMAIAAVFALGYLAFILFAQFVWFK